MTVHLFLLFVGTVNIVQNFWALTSVKNVDLAFDFKSHGWRYDTFIILSPLLEHAS